MLVNLSPLTRTMQETLRRLVAAIEEHDGISPINESGSLGIDGGREADFFFLGRRDDPFGFVICDERDGTLQVGVHPEHRRKGYATMLLSEALSSYPDFSLWAFGTLPGSRELAARLGLEPVRELLRMERSLLDSTPSEPTADGYRITGYTPADREAIVALNAAAFAHHPEQGRLTLAEFDELTAQPWFDPEGLLVARRGDEVAGFHWTKRHGGGLGEVYVIAVAKAHEGRGIGRVLLERGLDHLVYAGDDRVQLYVEADQTRAVRMYLASGFTVSQTDTSFHATKG